MEKKTEEDLEVNEKIYKTGSIGKKEAKNVKKRGFIDYIPKPS